MNTVPYCPSVAKMYIIFFFSILFTSLLTSANILKYSDKEKDSFFEVGIIINVISFISTLYILKVDLFDTNSKQSNIINYNKKCENALNDNIFIIIFTVCSIYLIIFGIKNLNEFKKKIDVNPSEFYTKFTYICILSVISGALGLLYVISNLLILIPKF
jgi:hypothetical protein